MKAETTASEELARLLDEQRRAQDRVGDVDAEQRATTIAAQEASETLVELERTGGTAAQRKKLEGELEAARARANAPWNERRAGAAAAARDAAARVRQYATEHLPELVAALEDDGRRAAEEVDRAAEQFVQAVERRVAIEGELAATVSLVRPVRPGDYNRARSDEAVAAVRRLLSTGGESAPKLMIELKDAAA